MAEALIIRRGSGSGGGSYTGEMISFMAIPAKTDSGGTTGSVRFKAEKPADATGYDIKYKTSAWVNGVDTHESGTLVQACDQDYTGTNVWLEVSGLPLNQDLYFAAFPKKNNKYNDAIGVANVTRSRSGGLIGEYTMDSITGTTLYDTSGNTKNATLVNSVTTEAGTVGNCVKGDGSSARIDIPNSGMNLVNKTITGFFKFNTILTSGNGYLLCADGSYYTNGGYCIRMDSNGIVVDPKSAGGTRFTDYLTDNNFFCMKHTENNCKVRRNAEENIASTGENVPSSSPANAPVRLFSNRIGSSEYGNGTVDQLRFYDRELQDFEVDTLYNGGAGC